MGTTPMMPGQQAIVTVAGQDDGTPPNPAVASITSYTVDDHAIVYAVGNDVNPIIPTGEILIVARGPIGNATLTVNANNALGSALPAQTAVFAVSGGPAVGFTLSVGTPFATGLNTPGIPAGW